MPVPQKVYFSQYPARACLDALPAGDTIVGGSGGYIFRHRDSKILPSLHCLLFYDAKLQREDIGINGKNKVKVVLFKVFTVF